MCFSLLLPVLVISKCPRGKWDLTTIPIPFLSTVVFISQIMIFFFLYLYFTEYTMVSDSEDSDADLRKLDLKYIYDG